MKEIFEFITGNWDSALVVTAVIIAFVILAVKKEWGILKQIAFGILTWAEQTYGGRSGALKLSAVLEKLYPKIPAVIRIFVTEKQLVKFVEKALIAAKEKWKTNPMLISTAVEQKKVGF